MEVLIAKKVKFTRNRDCYILQTAYMYILSWEWAGTIQTSFNAAPNTGSPGSFPVSHYMPINQS